MIFPFDPSEGLIVIPVAIEGAAGRTVARLALDTGANRSVVSWEILMHLGYACDASSNAAQITTASGEEAAPLIVVRRIEALSQVRTGFTVVGHTLPAAAHVDGVLGLNFLQGTRLILDFRAGLLEID